MQIWNPLLEIYKEGQEIIITDENYIFKKWSLLHAICKTYFWDIVFNIEIANEKSKVLVYSYIKTYIDTFLVTWGLSQITSPAQKKTKDFLKEWILYCWIYTNEDQKIKSFIVN
jgi:hypothetical protein